MPFPESSYARTGRFSEIYPVGQGAAGKVYSAVDNLGRRVAVKEALPAAEGFAAFRTKFEKESRLQAALDHPNIVRVHHLEEDPETRELYLICEFADAGSLADLLEREGPLPEARAVAITLDICAALEETERRRVVHRDVKPSNILLFTTAGGGLIAKLADFGIAQDTKQRKTTMLPGTSHPGTPLYMAPEQADATVLVDTRADIFALGVTLWEVLTREDYKALLRDGAGPSLTAFSPGASPAVARVIARAVRANRDERYQTAHEFAADLRHVLDGTSLDPQTIRLASPAGPPPRAPGAWDPDPDSAAHSPFAWLTALGPFALAVALVALSALLTAFSLGITNFVTGGGSVVQVIAETSPPMLTPELAVPQTSTTVSAAAVPALPIEQQATPPSPPVPTGTPMGFVPPPPPVPTNTPSDLVPLSTDTPAGDCVAGSGTLATQSRPVTSFRSVLINAAGRVEIRQGNADSVTITADDNVLRLLIATVRGDELVLDQTRCSRNVREVRFTITVRDLRALTLAGAADATLDGISADELTLKIAGSGTIDASGQARWLAVDIGGAGEVRARALASEAAQVRIGGTGSVALSASDSLDVGISGTGSVVYFGAPAVTQSITGAGSVQGAGAP